MNGQVYDSIRYPKILRITEHVQTVCTRPFLLPPPERAWRWGCLTTALPHYWTTSLPDYFTTGLLTTWLLNYYLTTAVQDYLPTALQDYLTTGLPPYSCVEGSQKYACMRRHATATCYPCITRCSRAKYLLCTMCTHAHLFITPQGAKCFRGRNNMHVVGC